MNVKKSLVLFLVAISGFLLLHGHLDYQFLVSQGDHGRDLYCFKAASDGQLPYKDFWWVYGPIMPYYYGLFLKIFGVSIKSVLLGKLILNLSAGIFFFLSLSLFIPQLFAFTAALWFWTFQPDFFFTYNHAGGIAMLMAAVYALFLYLQNPRLKYLYGALLSIFLLCLIKINFGLAAFLIFIPSIFIIDKINKVPFSFSKNLFFATAMTLFPLALFLVYFSLLRELPIYAVRQCLPYLSGDHPHVASLTTTLPLWWNAIAFNVNANWPNRIFGLLLLSSVFLTLREIFLKETDIKIRKKMIFAVSISVVFYVVNLHEFFASAVLYRTFWAKPFSIFLVFLFIGFAMRRTPKILQVLLVSSLFCIILLRYTDHMTTVGIRKANGQYLALEKGQVFSDNPIRWFDTVKKTTQYLRGQLKDNETFFAVPYDPLYYFLSNKPSPTRQLIFFEHINIPEEQERKIIAELENKNVNTILVSNRARSGEAGLGTLGETYCPLLGKYIDDHFKEVAAFGDWENHPGWAWNHGVRILGRFPSD